MAARDKMAKKADKSSTVKLLGASCLFILHLFFPQVYSEPMSGKCMSLHPSVPVVVFGILTFLSV